MTEIAQAYPLQWPQGWKRCTSRRDAAFKAGRTGNSGGRRLELSDGVERVFKELRAMGVKDEAIVISSNCRPQLGGRGTMGSPDPGAAVYWTVGKVTRCMAIDQYTRLPDNLGAIGATIEAMRAIERHGGAEILDRAFTGFVALTGPATWHQLLEVDATATQDEIYKAHRRLSMRHHPDRPGGNADHMAALNKARDEGLAQARE